MAAIDLRCSQQRFWRMCSSLCEMFGRGNVVVHRKPTHTDQNLLFGSLPLEHKRSISRTRHHQAPREGKGCRNEHPTDQGERSSSESEKPRNTTSRSVSNTTLGQTGRSAVGAASTAQGSTCDPSNPRRSRILSK